MERRNPELVEDKRVLVIVPCGKRKIWDNNPNVGPVPAKDAYISPYFKLCKRFAERFSDRWIILSAKYGFITPEFVIHQGYDVSFKNKHKQTVSIEKLLEQAKKLRLKQFDVAIVLGGQEYVRVATTSLGTLGLKVVAPLHGLSIGSRQNMLKRALSGQLDMTCD